MSSTAASPLSRTATPFAAAQAAHPRLEAASGFHSLVEDQGRDQAGASAPSAAKPVQAFAAKPKVTGAADGESTSKAFAPSFSTAVAAATDAASQPPITNPYPALPQAADTGSSGKAQPSATATGGASTQAAAAPLPAGPKARLGASSTAPPTSDDLAEADEEAGGTGEPLPDGAQAGSQAASPAGPSSGTAPPALAAGSAAQPLVAALSGSGATLVKAQAGPTGAGLRTAAATLARGKGAVASDPIGKAAASLPAAAQADAAQAPILLALAGTRSQDDPSDDSASDDGSASTDDSAAAATQTGSAPVTGLSTQSSSQATMATPMSASAADLAAQMAAKISAGSSRFQLQLNPLGLGRVDVSVSIGGDRQLTAALSFADPQTASALSAHAGELKTALEQAGFNVPAGGFDFTSGAAGAMDANLQGGFDPGASSGGSFGNGGSGAPGGGGMAAFGAGEALAAAGANDSTAWTAGGDSRLDMRI